MRPTADRAILRELSNERIAVDMEDATRHERLGRAVQVYIGGEFESADGQ